MTQQQNIESQERFGNAVNSGDLDALDELVAPECVDHDPAPGQAGGPQGFRDMYTELRTVFPNLHIEVNHLFANDDEVAFAYTITGTQDGALQGNEPTGKSVSFRGVQISKFADGKLVERWGSSNELGMLHQLGLA